MQSSRKPLLLLDEYDAPILSAWEKGYGAEMKRQGVDDVWRYGIAFCGKRVWMTGE